MKKTKDLLIDIMEEVGAKEIADKLYSEEEVISILYEQLEALDFYGSDFKFADWFEEVRKK
jgi:hypothetical protein